MSIPVNYKTEHELCPTCRGSSFDSTGEDDCPNCGGLGTVPRASVAPRRYRVRLVSGSDPVLETTPSRNPRIRAFDTPGDAIRAFQAVHGCAEWCGTMLMELGEAAPTKGGGA